MISGAALKVLSCFFENDTISFSELCRQTGYATDLGGYYIRQLVTAGSLMKTDRGLYTITPQGKQQLISVTPKTPKTTLTNPRVCVMALPMQDNHYIVMRRKRQPYIGYAEWPASRVALGQDLQEKVTDMLSARLGTSGELKFVGFFRRIDIVEEAIFDDKLFAVHACTLAEGAAILPESAHGYNISVTAAEIEALPNAHDALRDIMHFAEKAEPYKEVRYHLAPEDLHI